MRSFQVVENKINESDFFLEHLKSSKGVEIIYYLSAYLSATRSITFALQVAMRGIDGFEEWYKLQQHKLKGNPIALYLLEVRNYTLHEGEYPIYSRLFFASHPSEQLFFTQVPGKSQLEVPKENVIETCRQYMIMLLEIIRDCFQRFGYVMDPVLRFNHVISSKEKTLEDIEEELGFPRGWTNIADASQEDRVHILRQELKKNLSIDFIFYKYLGTDRLGSIV